MYPINVYENAEPKGLDFETFRNKMVEICNKHKQEDKALAFGFILCDFASPQIRKILNDREYWLALDDITGAYLSVFSLNYEPQECVPPTLNTKCMYSLTSILTSYNPRVATNTLIQKYFKETEINYPAILFFQVDKNKIIDSLLIDLEEQEIEKAFLELKNYLKSAVFALKRITTENKENAKEIFNCLEEEVKSLRTARKIRRIKQNMSGITDLLSAIKGIL